jgi:hypothetical protein
LFFAKNVEGGKKPKGRRKKNRGIDEIAYAPAIT